MVFPALNQYCQTGIIHQLIYLLFVKKLKYFILLNVRNVELQFYGLKGHKHKETKNGSAGDKL